MEKIIRLIKKDKNYRFSTNLTPYEMFLVTYPRLIQIFRGMFVRLFLKESNGLLFIGYKVSLNHMNKISVGRNVIIADYVNLNALSTNGIVLGDNVTISQNSILIGSGVIRNKGVGITIGNNTGINARAYLGGQGGINIGNDVIIGPDVKIFSENHIFSSIDIIIKNQGESRKGVIIEDNCWIGAGAIILDGVRLGKGTIVAAGSVVTKSFATNLIIGGVPASIIKERR
jgi:acetyltransferase-like isoleucine patch superfamily enzyme